MLNAAIVPKRDGVAFPAKATGEFRTDGVSVEVLQEGPALLDRHILEPDGEGGIDVATFAPGPRMCADHGVPAPLVATTAAPDHHPLQRCEFRVAWALAEAIHLPGAVDRRQPADQPFHSRRQRFVS